MIDGLLVRDMEDLAVAEEIVAKRITRAGMNVTPREFFPADKEQEEAIKEIANRIRILKITLWASVIVSLVSLIYTYGSIYLWPKPTGTNSAAHVK